MNITSLADFKRKLKQPGAHVTMTKMPHAYNDHARKYFESVIGVPRPVMKVQGEQFSMLTFGKESWMGFGKAAQWTFNGDIASYDPGSDLLPMVFKLSVTA